MQNTSDESEKTPIFGTKAQATKTRKSSEAESHPIPHKRKKPIHNQIRNFSSPLLSFSPHNPPPSLRKFSPYLPPPLSSPFHYFIPSPVFYLPVPGAPAPGYPGYWKPGGMFGGRPGIANGNPKPGVGGATPGAVLLSRPPTGIAFAFEVSPLRFPW